MALIEIFAESREPGTCRSCHAPITWARLRASGRVMPFDALAPVRTYTDTADRIVSVVDTSTSLSHFATCPHAAAWRAPRKAAKP